MVYKNVKSYTKEKVDYMSIVSVVYLPEGIVIAADSRLIGNRSVTQNGVTTVEKFPISDNAQGFCNTSRYHA